MLHILIDSPWFTELLFSGKLGNCESDPRSDTQALGKLDALGRGRREWEE